LGIRVYAGEDLPVEEPKPLPTNPAAEAKMRACKTLAEMVKVWTELSPEERRAVSYIKDELKDKLT
jgi:hypothetical protein